MVPEGDSLLRTLSKWNGKGGLSYPFTFMLYVTPSFSLSSYPISKLFPCPPFIFLLAYRVFTIIFSISICFPFILVDLCYSFSLQKGWRTYFLFSKTVVDPPSFLRLLLDSLLERRRKRSSSWCCRWTRSSQVTSYPHPFLSVTDFSKISGFPFYHSVREGPGTFAHTCIQSRVWNLLLCLSSPKP